MGDPQTHLNFFLETLDNLLIFTTASKCECYQKLFLNSSVSSRKF